MHVLHLLGLLLYPVGVVSLCLSRRHMRAHTHPISAGRGKFLARVLDRVMLTATRLHQSCVCSCSTHFIVGARSPSWMGPAPISEPIYPVNLMNVIHSGVHFNVILHTGSPEGTSMLTLISLVWSLSCDACAPSARWDTFHPVPRGLCLCRSKCACTHTYLITAG